MATVKCNFASVFAMYKSVEELNVVANEIRSQLITAYEEAKKRLAPEEKAEVSIEVASEKKGRGTKKSSATKKETAKTETKTKAEKTTKKAAKVEKKMERVAEKTEQIALTDKKTIKSYGFKWVDYSEKAFVLASDKDTKALHNELTKLGGRWNGHLKNCGEGSWIFSKAKSADSVKKALKGLYKTVKSA